MCERQIIIKNNIIMLLVRCICAQNESESVNITSLIIKNCKLIKKCSIYKKAL